MSTVFAGLRTPCTVPLIPVLAPQLLLYQTGFQERSRSTEAACVILRPIAGILKFVQNIITRHNLPTEDLQSRGEVTSAIAAVGAPEKRAGAAERADVAAWSARR
jgi:hypothetical protein